MGSESRSAQKTCVETDGDKSERQKECANADNRVSRGEHRRADGTRRVEGRDTSKTPAAKRTTAEGIADECIVLLNFSYGRARSRRRYRFCDS